MPAFSTPEEAARGDLREEYVRVVGVAIRGDQAVVAQIMNADGYPSAYEIETAMCGLTSDGWVSGSSGNHNMTSMLTGDGRCTVVWWEEAPDGVTGARIRLEEQEREVPVRDGFFFVVFDDVAWNAEFDLRADWPHLPPGISGFIRTQHTRERPKLDWYHERPRVVDWIRPAERR